MGKYIAVYKCPLCGRLIYTTDPQEVPYDKLPELCAKVVQNQLFAGNVYLHKAQFYIPHKCKDGNCGLAAFAGFKKWDGE